jgi:hypothetical protein
MYAFHGTAYQHKKPIVKFVNVFVFSCWNFVFITNSLVCYHDSAYPSLKYIKVIGFQAPVSNCSFCVKTHYKLWTLATDPCYICTVMITHKTICDKKNVPTWKHEQFETGAWNPITLIYFNDGCCVGFYYFSWIASPLVISHVAWVNDCCLTSIQQFFRYIMTVIPRTMKIVFVASPLSTQH